MLVIGIILLLLGLALGGFVVAGGLPGQAGTDVTFSLFGVSVDTSVVVVFALGALTLLLLELGVLALRSGARKSAKRRSELQRLRRVEAEVQARQAAESERTTATTTSAPPAHTPFARRDPDASRAGTTTGTTTGADGSRSDVTRGDVSRSDRDDAPGTTSTTGGPGADPDTRPPATTTDETRPAPSLHHDDDGSTRADRT